MSKNKVESPKGVDIRKAPAPKPVGSSEGSTSWMIPMELKAGTIQPARPASADRSSPWPSQKNNDPWASAPKEKDSEADDRIDAGLSETSAVEPAGRLRVPNVKTLRAATGLSQAAFSERFGVALNALQNWEQMRRMPDRTARILLRMIDAHPDLVAEAAAAEEKDNPS